MPQFQRKAVKCINRGMTLNRPVDLVPENQWWYLRNVRSYVDGRIEARPGLTLASNEFTPSGGTDYIHSGYTLGDHNPDSTGGTMRFAGFNTELWTQSLGPGNPFLQTDTGFSGKPLSMVAMNPDQSPAPWLYVADSNKMRRYSSSDLTAGVPTAWQVGMPPPTVAPAPVAAAGSLTGDYYYRFRYRDPATGAKSLPGPANGYGTTGLVPNYAPITLAGQGAQIACPAPGGTVVVDVFRFGGAVLDWRLVATGASGATVIDTMSDTDALSAETLDLDAYQPFPTMDIKRTGTCTTVAATPGTLGNGSYITQTGGDGFNADWAAGNVITINEVPYTLKRYVSPTVWEIEEDAGTQAAPVPWTLDGGLILGQPVPHIWGPFGGGESGVVIFGCGDPRRPGWLYWTNGNDPDSTSLANALEITSPSEPLVNGCIYDGRCFVWSTERMFAVYPAGNGQFHAQVIPGAKGLFAPWGLCVGEHIFFISKDGIYVTAGGVPQCITDDQLYPAFPHDGQPGYTFTRGADTIQPPDPAHPEYWRLSYGDGFLYFDFVEYSSGKAKAWVYDTRIAKGWSLDDYYFDGACSRWWEEGYHSLLVGIGASLYYFTGVNDGGFDINCQIQSGADTLGDPRAKKLIGDCLFTCNPRASGGPPANPTITVKLLADNNATTLATGTTNSSDWVQVLLDVNNGIGTLARTVGIDVTWASNASTAQIFEWHPSWVPKPETTGKRGTDWTNEGQAVAKWVRGCVIEGDISTVTAADLVVDGADNKKVTSASHTFVAGDAGAVIAITSGTDWTVGEYEVVSVAGGAATLDRSPAAAGKASGSYALGGIRTVQVQSDGSVLRATIKVSHPGQTEHAYSFPPFIAHEMRLVPTDSATWQEFGVRWLWDPYPEYLGDIPDFTDEGFPGWKYVRGCVITADTQGVAVDVQAQYDGSTIAGTLSVTASGRTQATYAFATPFLAQLLRLVPLGKWRKFAVRWIYDEYPDFGQILTPWMQTGNAPSNHLRGVVMKVDTANAAVKFDVQGDGGVVLYSDLEVKGDGQVEVPVYFAAPKVTHLARLVPKGDWRLWMPVAWVSDPFPELTRFVTPWSDAGKLGAKHVRGLVLKADSGNLAVPVQVQRETGAVLGTISVQHNGPDVKPYSLTPAVAALLRLVPQGNVRIWDDQIGWVFDPYPELSTMTTEWWNGEYPYAKFMQGMRITADTGNLPVQLQIQYDGGLVGATVTVQHNGLQTLPYSWTPFIGHNFRIVPLGPIRIFKEPSWVWEPVPELATIWQTQETSHDIPGWHHLRDGYIAHQSTADITLRVAYEGKTVDYLIASGGGQYARPYLEFQPMKARYRSYRLTSAAPFRLFVKDCEVRCKGWSESGPYQIKQPFGDISRESGARI